MTNFPFRSIVFGKEIRSRNTPEDDCWAIERGGRGRESNDGESGGSD